MLSDDRYRKECIFFHEGATLTMHEFFFYMVLPLHLKQTFLPIKEKMDALNSNIAPSGLRVEGQGCRAYSVLLLRVPCKERSFSIGRQCALVFFTASYLTHLADQFTES
jgi:hypothetical protein